MTTVSDIMSREVQSIGPQQTLRQAAEWMKRLDIGALPVMQGGVLQGIVTDRDIAIRGVAAGLAPELACVSEVMSEDPVFCTPEQGVHEVMDLMGVRQLRRLPVLDRDRQLVGIVSIADLASRQDEHIDGVVREISDPGAAVLQLEVEDEDADPVGPRR